MSEVNFCTRCKKGTEEYDYIRSPVDTESQLHCPACAVELWDCNVRFIWHLGVPDTIRQHLQSFKMLRKFQRWFRSSRRFYVHVFHRLESDNVDWMSRWSTHTKPAPPYSYRGWCSYDYTVLLWDDTETSQSIEWILYHELGHYVCSQVAYMFDTAMDLENQLEGRGPYEWKDDTMHEADSEERLVNRVATALMGGQERARPWWRPRVTAKQRGYLVLPDGFAPPNSAEFRLFCLARKEGWASPLPILGLDEAAVATGMQWLSEHPMPVELGRQEGFRDVLESVYDAVQVLGPMTGTLMVE